MSYSNSDPPRSSCCSTSNADSTELKLYQAFIFSVTIFFTFVLLFLFYLFYLRPRRVDWSSLRMRASVDEINNDISNQSELGLKKELREMLPIVVYMESFSVKDTQCSVCLLDYQAEDRLQQIPACGHTFHMNCIDLWLSNNSTCPLCRMSLLASARSSEEPACIQVYEETPTTEFFQLRSTSHSGKSIFQNCSKEDSIGARCTNHERDLDDT
ncbi:RING-H2 finger protein [Quillaja saponaria]|uniref:RING-type E3 ubiquitin transferase n=1 Tax=Quillaja saponaria TaxID=32244 RepID=A0AAD7VNQ7_QUISA|nr:RING-H2 finger protein [Quillaja saponaria]